MVTANIAAWEAFARAWRRLEASIIRPRPAEIDLYQELISPALEGRNPARVVVLGATPELRWMLTHQFAAEVVLIDSSRDMVRAMTALMPAPNPRETWVCADWLAAKPEGRFDAVVADMVLSNLVFDQHDQLLRNVRSWLNPDGVFVTRIESFKSSHRRLETIEYFRLFEGREADDETIVRFWDAAWLTDSIESHGIAVRSIYERITGQLKERPHAEVQEILRRGGILFPLDKVWHTYREDELLQTLGTHFQIAAQRWSSDVDPLLRDFPRIYELVPKESAGREHYRVPR